MAFFTKRDLGIIRRAIRNRKNNDPSFRQGMLHTEAQIDKNVVWRILYADRVIIPDSESVMRLARVLGINDRMDCQLSGLLGADRAPEAQLQVQPSLGVIASPAPSLTPERLRFLGMDLENTLGWIEGALSSAGETGSMLDSVVGRLGFSMALFKAMNVVPYQRLVHHSSFLVGYKLGLMDALRRDVGAVAPIKHEGSPQVYPLLAALEGTDEPIVAATLGRKTEVNMPKLDTVKTFGTKANAPKEEPSGKKPKPTIEELLKNRVRSPEKAKKTNKTKKGGAK